MMMVVATSAAMTMVQCSSNYLDIQWGNVYDVYHVHDELIQHLIFCCIEDGMKMENNIWPLKRFRYRILNIRELEMTLALCRTVRLRLRLINMK